MKYIFTEKAPKASGHYSQAIIHEGVVYISGQLPINPHNESKHVGTIEEQTEQVLKNLTNILLSSGSDISNVLRTTIYVSDIKLWDKVNKTYSDFFIDHYPARTIVPTNELHYGYQIEIDAIAIVKKEA